VVSTRSRFGRAGECFDLEHAGPVIRIWCRACSKHELLSDDEERTVEAAKEAHRCGERISPWDRGDTGGRV
jgi:hypothetical protein